MEAIVCHRAAPGDRIAQACVRRPVLFQGRKVDFRLYLAVRSFEGREAYLFRRFYGRVANNVYSLEPDQAHDHHTHFTVSCYDPDEAVRSQQLMVPYDDLVAELESQGLDVAGIKSQLHDLAHNLLAAGSYQIGSWPRSRAVYGLDVLLEQGRAARLRAVVDASEPAEGDVEQLRSAVMAVLAAGKDGSASSAEADVQDVLHITSKLWNKCVETKDPNGKAPRWQLQLRQLASDLLSMLKEAELPAGWLTVPFKLYFQMLRLMAAAYLKIGNAALALQCVQGQRMLPPRLAEQCSVQYQALQSFLQLDRIQDAEKELQAILSNQDASKALCLDALSAVSKQHCTSALHSAIDMVLNRFTDDPAFVCSLANVLLSSVDKVGAESEGADQLTLMAVGKEAVLNLLNNGDAGARAKEGIFSLLWNRGTEHFQAKAYSAAADMYAAALLYATADGDKAQTARQLALCHLGADQSSKSLDYVAIAEKSQPGGISTAFIRFKVATQEAYSAGASAVVNYIELSDYFNQASRHMAEVGAAHFFGDDDGRPRDLEWFATMAWNTGREAGLAGDFMSSAVLFGACADFYSAHPVKDVANCGRQKVRDPVI
ncbi:hypothetical protein WJX81_001585 [Elliptochloris bilobata]|uniref:Protein ZIP4 homolog n=1 Tax=Elliptochloris bilobata TaxID=381761 RepID=A0AAW1SHT7_9CHLO